MQVERLCDKCDRPVSGKLFKGMCRRCYDRLRVITTISVSKRLEPLFLEYAGERDDTSRCIIELMELGLNTWKNGQWVRIVPREINATSEA
jgi:hypothetical protein